MIKVYCLFHRIDYEGTDLFGIYSTKDKAKEALRFHVNKERNSKYQFSLDGTRAEYDDVIYYISEEEVL